MKTRILFIDITTGEATHSWNCGTMTSPAALSEARRLAYENIKDFIEMRVIQAAKWRWVLLFY